MENTNERKHLPVYPDIKEQYDKAGSNDLKELLLELVVARALKEDKGLKKRLGMTFDNRRMADGSIRHLIGFYERDVFSERQADDFIISGREDITKMWVADKYGYIAEMLK